MSHTSVRRLQIKRLRPPQHTATQHCNTLHYTATGCNVLQQTATNVRTSAINGRSCACNGTATHRNTPQQTATDCNRLQQTATDCNRLQQTATHAATNARTSAINRRCFDLNSPCRILGLKKRHEPISLRPMNIHMYIHSHIVHIYM